MKSILHIADSGIKSRIVIIVTVIFAFFITMSLLFSLYSLETRTEKEMAEFRESETERTREALKSYVHIAYTAVETNYKNATDVTYLSDYYGDRLRNLIDIAEAVLKDKAKAVKTGRLTKAAAQKQAIALIKKMTYDDGNGYYFIFTNEKPFPKMIVEPYLPELDGQVLSGDRFNNASGSNKNLFVAGIESIGDKKEGFIDYIWPRPSVNKGGALDIPKFSYLRVFEEWNWVIGTGIYLDDAIKDCMKKSKSDLRYMRYDNGTGYYWINDNLRPTPRLIMNPFLPQSEGQILTDKKYNRAFGEDYNLYEAFLDACEETGDGIVDYNWDKPVKGGILEDAPKTSYVKYFKPLGWVIGSGVYIDDIDKAINSKLTLMEEQKRNLIVNYLLISLTLAAISIGVLVFMMNRYFKDLEKRQEKDLGILQEDENGTTQSVDSALTDAEEEPEKVALKQAGVEPQKQSEKEESISSAAEAVDVSRILEVVLKEQTKQLALNKLTEQEIQQKSSEELSSLKTEIKNLISEVKATNK